MSLASYGFRKSNWTRYASAKQHRCVHVIQLHPNRLNVLTPLQSDQLRSWIGHNVRGDYDLSCSLLAFADADEALLFHMTFARNAKSD